MLPTYTKMHGCLTTDDLKRLVSTTEAGLAQLRVAIRDATNCSLGDPRPQVGDPEGDGISIPQCYLNDPGARKKYCNQANCTTCLQEVRGGQYQCKSARVCLGQSPSGGETCGIPYTGCDLRDPNCNRDNGCLQCFSCTDLDGA